MGRQDCVPLALYRFLCILSATGNGAGDSVGVNFMNAETDGENCLHMVQPVSRVCSGIRATVCPLHTHATVLSIVFVNCERIVRFTRSRVPCYVQVNAFCMDATLRIYTEGFARPR